MILRHRTIEALAQEIDKSRTQVQGLRSTSMGVRGGACDLDFFPPAAAFEVSGTVPLSFNQL